MTSKVERLREQAEQIAKQLKEAESAEAARLAARAKKRLDRAATKSGLTALLGADGRITGAALETEFRRLVERLNSANEPGARPAAPLAGESEEAVTESNESGAAAESKRRIFSR